MIDLIFGILGFALLVECDGIRQRMAAISLEYYMIDLIFGILGFALFAIIFAAIAQVKEQLTRKRAVGERPCEIATEPNIFVVSWFIIVI